jgi:hypothetical protein
MGQASRATYQHPMAARENRSLWAPGRWSARRGRLHDVMTPGSSADATVRGSAARAQSGQALCRHCDGQARAGPSTKQSRRAQAAHAWFWANAQVANEAPAARAAPLLARGSTSERRAPVRLESTSGPRATRSRTTVARWRRSLAPPCGRYQACAFLLGDASFHNTAQARAVPRDDLRVLARVRRIS